VVLCAGRVRLRLLRLCIRRCVLAFLGTAHALSVTVFQERKYIIIRK